MLATYWPLFCLTSPCYQTRDAAPRAKLDFRRHRHLGSVPTRLLSMMEVSLNGNNWELDWIVQINDTQRFAIQFIASHLTSLVQTRSEAQKLWTCGGAGQKDTEELNGSREGWNRRAGIGESLLGSPTLMWIGWWGRKACALDRALALYVRELVHVAFSAQWYGNCNRLWS
jgi:hypothetical protein